MAWALPEWQHYLPFGFLAANTPARQACREANA
jgi:hypothetical protein